MTNYMFQRIAEDGNVIATTHYECESDESALAHAMDNASRCAIEIWRDETKVGHVDGGSIGLHGVREATNLPDCDPNETGRS